MMSIATASELGVRGDVGFADDVDVELKVLAQPPFCWRS